MAEDPKIVPSPPPAEPVDVRVSPSPGPSEPFDVPTYPDPPPAEPFDVQTYPDPPPGGTVDVPTSPDPGPREPVDVPTTPDGPPVKPYDVPTPPDPGPRDPVDVPTSPDMPPLEPYDVPTAPDGPPIEPVDVPTNPDEPPDVPFDVQTSPDAAPAEPFDVPTAPDGPPVEPVDVGVSLDPPPSEPFDVPITFDPPPFLLEGNPGGIPTIDGIINAVKTFDARLGSFLSTLVDISPISVSIQGGGALDPRALAEWLKTYVNTVGPGGLGRFIAEQSALYAMNPVVARVFNPAYFNIMLIPGAMGNFHTTIDTQAGLTANVVALANDEIVQAEAVIDPDINSSRLNVYSPIKTMIEGQDFSIDEMVDAAIDNVPHPFMTVRKDDNGLETKKFDAAKYFNDRDSSGGQTARLSTRNRVGIENLQSREGTLVSSNFLNGVIRMRISPKEDEDGAVYTQDMNSATFIDDDETRVPLCFTDLRKTSRGYRTVYFRPLNLSFSEQLSPDWQESAAFGRVDPIVSYQRTTRTFNVSFELHAFAPEDLRVMYNKMVWLQSMCYPSYGTDSLMRSGPAIRMRIGDAISTESGGLPGIIRSLSFDFADALWELKKGLKVPRSFKVSLDYLALHEGPVGIMGDEFGVFQLPPGGTPSDADTSKESSPEDSREAPPRVAVRLPGRFSKFGEPKR